MPLEDCGQLTRMGSQVQPAEQPGDEAEDRERGHSKPDSMPAGLSPLPQMGDFLGTFRERSLQGGPQLPSRMPRHSEQNDGQLSTQDSQIPRQVL